MKFTKLSTGETFEFDHLGDGFFNYQGHKFSELMMSRLGYVKQVDVDPNAPPEPLEFGDPEAISDEFLATRYKYQQG